MAHSPPPSTQDPLRADEIPQNPRAPIPSASSIPKPNPRGLQRNDSTTNHYGSSGPSDLPPHIHGMLTRASTHLLSQQKSESVVSNGQYEGQALGAKPVQQHKSHRQRPDRRADCHAESDLLLDFYRKANTALARAPVAPAGPGYYFSRAPRARFGDQQSDPYRQVQLQINYLDSLAARVPSLGSLSHEMRLKENFREKLAKIAQEALRLYAMEQGYTIDPRAINLKCFGSLRNGFALPGADLDLIMKGLPDVLEAEGPQVLEKAFLDAGFGARLISKTRIPIIKLCETPRHKGLSHETPNSLEPASTSQITNQRHSRKKPKVNLSDLGSGIQCDINFSEILALHNTELLRAYALSDERIRLLGVFIKMWAKARKINSPYHGTMCSYGYILMVIHYVVNIAYPALVPNLQLIHQSSHTVNGCDIQFLNDEQQLRGIGSFNAKFGNQQSVGELLRGFFAYYGSRGRDAPRGGFDWVRSIISIRTQGGLLPKIKKEWNTAKTDINGNRLRFLIAIEDPFEHDHNIARTVTQSGLNAIRAEFHRAQIIIHRIQEIPGAGWEWRTDDGDIGHDFLAVAKDHQRIKHQERPRSQQPQNGIDAHKPHQPDGCQEAIKSGTPNTMSQQGRNGVMLDARQFYSPIAIHGRRLTSDGVSTSASDSETGAMRKASEIKNKDLLASLPFC